MKMCPLGLDLGTGDCQVLSGDLNQKPRSLLTRRLAEAAAHGTCCIQMALADSLLGESARELAPLGHRVRLVTNGR